mmetsp:Transcript_7053/g.9191  ORF Transcript_7053/g.9191 Transcript_7053/m.9191 type:complete len:813 (+) Transcript_7053:284-2722(+)
MKSKMKTPFFLLLSLNLFLFQAHGLQCARGTSPATFTSEVCDDGSFCVGALMDVIYPVVTIPVCYAFGCAVFNESDCTHNSCFIISEPNATNGTFSETRVTGLNTSAPYTMTKCSGADNCNWYPYFNNSSPMNCVADGEILDFSLRDDDSDPEPGEGEFLCADQTIRGRTDEIVNVPCSTFCLVGYSTNTFLNLFYGVDAKICQPLGCANVDENGNFINDAADRLGTALQGELTVYECDESSFLTDAESLQASEGNQPCNWYNPESINGVVDLSEQVCIGLDIVGTGFNKVSWILRNLWAFLGILAVALIGCIVCCVCSCIRRQRKSRKESKITILDAKQDIDFDSDFVGALPIKDELVILFSQLIQKNKGVSGLNVFVLFVNSGITISLLVFLSSMQAFLLPEVYDVSTDDLGRATANIGLVDELWSLVTLGIWGVISDRIGRRMVVILGYLHVAVGMWIMPNAGSVYPGLLLARLVYAQGVSALVSMLPALLADYIKPEYLGKASGIMGIFSGVGALFGVFVLVGQIPKNYCVENTYYIASIVPLVMSVVCFLGLQSSARLTESLQDHETGNEERNLFKTFIIGLREANKQPRIGLAYIAGTLARADSAIVSIFIALWVNKHYIDEGLCVTESYSNVTDAITTVCGELLENEDEVECPAAFTHTSRVSGIANTAALLFSPLAGYLSDKLDPVKSVGIAAVIGCISYALVGIVDDVNDSTIYFVVGLFGISQIFMIVASQSLLSKYMPPHLRGTVSGCFSLFGAFGIMFITYVGGILFDEWFVGAPFVLTSLMNLVLIVSVIVFYLKHIRK